MYNFVILTDNTVDMPVEWLNEHEVGYECLPCSMNGVVYDKKNPIDTKLFYRQMREGAMPTTSQMNPAMAEAMFETYLQKGKDILYLAFSSGLSGTCNSARIAAEELKEKYPERQIKIMDSLAASMGEGLLLYYAVKLRDKGKNLDEIGDWLLENRLHLCHVFTVDDLNHLHRGGRVSKATAVLGTLANIKPMLHVDNEGKLISIGKVRGRKKSLATLVSMMEERIGRYCDKNETVFVSHGDCEADAEYVAGLVKEKFGIENIMIHPISATIGAHSGPGTVALFFLGEYR